MRRQCQNTYNGTCHLRIAVEEWIPWIEVKGYQGRLNVSGPIKILLDSISTTLNVSYSMSLSKERVFGSLRKNSSWSGVIGMIQRKESDIAAGPLTQTYRRMEAVGFSNPIAQETYRMLVWQQGKSADAQYSYLLVLSATVWVLLVLSWCLISLVETIHASAVTKRSASSSLETYLDGLWKYFSIEFRQSVSHLKMDNRFLLTFWLLSSTVMVSIFGCNLVSLLMREDNAHPIGKVTDLNKYPDIDLVVSKDSSYEIWLKEHPDPSVRSLYDAMTKKEGCFVPLSEFDKNPLMERVRNRKSVVLVDFFTIFHMLAKRARSKLKCVYHTVPVEGSPKPIAMAWDKDLPKQFKDVINHRILVFWESGIIRELVSSELREADTCLRTTKKEEGKDPLLFRDTKGIFYTWIGGLFLSATGLMLEKFVYKLSKSCNRGLIDGFRDQKVTETILRVITLGIFTNVNANETK